MIVKMIKTDGDVLELNHQTSLSNITLNQKVTFDTYYDLLEAWLKKTKEDGDIIHERNFYLFHVCRCLSKFYGKDIVEFLEVDISNISDDEFNVDYDLFVKHLKGEDDIEITQETENNLLQLFANVRNLCRSYKYKTIKKFEFDIDGGKYSLPAIVGETFSGKKIRQQLNTIQGVEAMQTRLELKRFLAKEKDPVKREDGTYSLYIRVVASLIREEGENIPLDPDKFAERTEKVMVKIKDVDAKTGLDIVFFSLNFWMNSKKTKTIAESLVSQEEK